MPLDITLFKARVKGPVRFAYFRDGSLWYVAEDGWEFPVPVEDTSNAQGACPSFKAEEKGITMMRWIRVRMEEEASWETERKAHFGPP